MTKTSTTPIYKDPSQPIAKRVDDLLARMTLRDKLGQMNMPILTPAVFAQQFFDHRLPGTQEDSHALIKGDYDPSIGSIGGFYGAAAIIGGGSPSEQATFLKELQSRAAEQPLGIPLLFTEEAICGLWTGGATIFPEGITLGATFNANLIEHISQVMAEEAQAIGVHQITFVTEPYCDPALVVTVKPIQKIPTGVLK